MQADAAAEQARVSIVVTGAAGFIGATLVPALSAAGHAVVAVDRRPLLRSGLLPGSGGAAERGGAAIGGSGGVVRTIRAELTADRVDVADALREAEAVIHLAGCPGVRDAGADVEHRRSRDNIHATSVVLRRTPARTPVIALSSSSVYGGTGAVDGGNRARGSRESDPLAPRGGYAASKVAAEGLCRQRAQRGGRVLVVRPFTVLGEGQRADMAISRWLMAALSGQPLRLLGSPTRSRDICDVRQVAAALLGLLRAGRTGTINLGTGHAHTLGEIAAQVCAAAGVSARYEIVPAGSAEVAHTLADTTALQQTLGWVPQTDVSEVIARAVRSLTAEWDCSVQRGHRHAELIAAGPSLAGPSIAAVP